VKKYTPPALQRLHLSLAFFARAEQESGGVAAAAQSSRPEEVKSVMHLMRFPRVWNVVVQYRVFFLLRTTLGQVLLSEPRGSSESLGDGVSMASCLCKNSGLANKVKTFQRAKGKKGKRGKTGQDSAKLPGQGKEPRFEWAESNLGIAMVGRSRR